MDPGQPHDDGWEGRRARRAEAARRRRMRRRMALIGAGVAIVGAGAGVVAMRSHPKRPTSGSSGQASSTATTKATRTANQSSSSSPRTAPPATQALRGPTPAQQQAAVARLVPLGLPIYRSAGTHGRYVALTFDDGPGPMTDQTIAKLRRYGARATFFMVGRNVAGWPAAPGRELRMGAIGDHTWDHVDLRRQSDGEVVRQMRSAQQTIARAADAPVRLFRPPYGARTALVDRTARGAGMIEVLWTIDSGDSAGASWDQMVTTLKRETKPGVIILLHENRGQTQRALNHYLPWLQKHGFHAVSVPELLAIDPPPLAQVRGDARRYAGIVGGS